MTLAINGSVAVPITAKGCWWAVRNTGDTALGGTTVMQVRNDDKGSDYAVGSALSIQASGTSEEQGTHIRRRSDP